MSRLARSQVTVSVSGDGGDELFAGCNRHVMGPKLWRRLRRLPQPMRRTIAGSLSLALRSRRLTASSSTPLLGEKLEKLRDAIGANDGMDFYHRLRAVWEDPAGFVLRANPSGPIPFQGAALADGLGLHEQMILADMQNYLPNDILTKMDHAGMAVSLEARVPMLDHRLVEFAWSVPDRFKVRDREGKWLLRQMLYRYVPKSLLDRPKAGFAVPLGAWVRGPLRDWAEALLAEDRIHREGFLDAAMVRRCWDNHLAGRPYGHAQIWNVLMFQAWLEHWHSN